VTYEAPHNNTAVSNVTVKSKVHPATGHQVPEGEYMYSYTLSPTSEVDGGWWSTPRPGCFTHGIDPVPIL